MAALTLTSTGATFPDGNTITSITDSALISANGWQKLPGGFIIQWGEFSVTWSGTTAGTNGSGSATFPIAFPNACLGLVASGGPCIGAVTTSTTGISCNYNFLGYVPSGAPGVVGTTRYIVFGH